MSADTTTPFRAPVRIIPCLDVRDGRIVKGVRFQSLRDAGDPVEQALLYQEQGADELTILDISATSEGRGNRLEVVRSIRAVLQIPLIVGGGVRSVEDAVALREAGADKVAIGTAGVETPELLSAISQAIGSERTIQALDVASADGGWEVVIRAGTERTGLDALAFAREAAQRGVGEVLLTSWDRDGTGSGYDLELLEAFCQAVSIPVIASGGASSAQDMADAVEAGAAAVLAASIFHEGRTTVRALKAELEERGILVRDDIPSSSSDREH